MVKMVNGGSSGSFVQAQRQGCRQLGRNLGEPGAAPPYFCQRSERAENEVVSDVTKQKNIIPLHAQGGIS